MDMMPIPITWSFSRKNFFPIISVTGTSSTSIVEPVLLQQANSFIDTAIQYKGYLFPEKPQHQKDIAIQVSFSVIFKTEDDLKKFIETLQK